MDELSQRGTIWMPLMGPRDCEMRRIVNDSTARLPVDLGKTDGTPGGLN
jgi:hypothetical protein